MAVWQERSHPFLKAMDMMEPAILILYSLRQKTEDMGMEVDLLADGLSNGDYARHNLYPLGRLEVPEEGLNGRVTELTEKLSPWSFFRP